MERYRLNDQACETLVEQSVRPMSLLSCPDQTRYLVTCEGNTLSVQDCENKKRTAWHLYKQSDQLTLEWADLYSAHPDVTELLAAIEATFVSQ